MNRRLVSGTVAGLAAVLLATGGTTLASFDDYTELAPNSLGAGVLRLDLAPDGTASTAISLEDLEPGNRISRVLWVAANDRTSVTAARLTITLRHLVDVPARCDTSRGKALGELQSGIAGCRVTATGVSGVPDEGTLSRLLRVRLAYIGGTCAVAGAGRSLLPIDSPGNLHRLASGSGTTIAVRDERSAPVELGPGDGACLAVSAAWPPDVTPPAAATPERPVDNAAQGDSLTVQLRVALTQDSP